MTSPFEAGDIPSEVDQEVHRRLIDALAQISIGTDPIVLERLMQAAAVQEQLDLAARQRVMAAEQMRARAASDQELREFPWRVVHLDEPHDHASIRAMVSAKVKEEDARQDRFREQKVATHVGLYEARQTTLSMGSYAAAKLRELGEAPDIDVKTERARQVRHWGGKVWNKNKITMLVTENYSDPLVSGWLLPVSGQIDGVTRTILCSDGQILTANGLFRAHDSKKQGMRDTLVVQPNRAGKATRKHGDKDIPGRPPLIYTSFLDQHMESDIGAVNTPVNSSTGRAQMLFNREYAVCEALDSVMVRHGINLPSTLPAPASP